jgi:putative ABC transport system permease protein
MTRNLWRPDMGVIDLFVSLLPVNIIQGLIYALVALGIMIPLRILSFPDLTSEGSFPLGACALAACLELDFSPIGATMVAVFSGALAGMATASIHRWLRINTMLCGIIVLTILFSINVRIMGKPNIALFSHPSVFSLMFGENSVNQYNQILLLGLLVAMVTVLLYFFFQTQAGMAMRAVGASVPMAKAQGIDVARYTSWGLAIGGALTALGASLQAQLQGFADVNLGFGVLINGLAAVILGEALLGNQSIKRQLLAPVVGAFIYFQVIGFVLALGLRPSDLKALTGMFVLITMLVPIVRKTDTGPTVGIRE